MSIVRDESICGGSPIIQGTRVTVSVVLANIRDGSNFAEICENFSIAEQDIKDCLDYVIDNVQSFSKPDYFVDDFVGEIISTYRFAKLSDFDEIVLVIDTGCETYYINDTDNGFQCDEFDCCYDSLGAIAMELFNRTMCGRPTEIRIE